MDGIRGTNMRPIKIEIELTQEDRIELYHAFKKRGSSNTKRKVAKWLREMDVALFGRYAFNSINEWYCNEEGELIDKPK